MPRAKPTYVRESERGEKGGQLIVGEAGKMMLTVVSVGIKAKQADLEIAPWRAVADSSRSSDGGDRGT